MIILEAFSVRDSKAEAFIQPFFCPTIAVAMRSFEQGCNDPNSNFRAFPNDYTLFHIGQFDTANGALTKLDAPQSLGLAAQFIRTEEG